MHANASHFMIRYVLNLTFPPNHPPLPDIASMRLDKRHAQSEFPHLINSSRFNRSLSQSVFLL